MNKLIPILSLIIIISCVEGKKAEGITDQQIKDAAITEGNRISSIAQKALGGQLKKAMGEGGPRHAVEFCNTAASPILDTLKTGLAVKIKRASLRLRNPKNTPDEQETQILKQYREFLENQGQIKPVVVSDKNQILYAKPILLNNPLCLNCHGMVGKEISDETHDLIKNLYPNDNAMNHRIGDLRGIWSITFEKDKLIKYLEQKEQL